MPTKKKSITARNERASSRKKRSKSKHDFTDVIPNALKSTTRYECYLATRYVDQTLRAKTRESGATALLSLVELITAQGTLQEQKMAQLFAGLQANSYMPEFPEVVKGLCENLQDPELTGILADLVV